MKLIKIIAIFLICLFFVNTVNIHASSFVFSNGYWWKDGVAYKRVKEKCWYRSGCCSYYKWCYRYHKVKTFSISSNTEGWRARLLDIASQRDRHVHRMKESALEHNEFLEAVSALNLHGAELSDPRFADGGFLFNNSTIAAQKNPFLGNTVFGYNIYSRAVDALGNLDEALLWNMADRHTSNAQYAGERAEERFKSLMSQKAESVERIQSILAKNETIRSILDKVDTPRIRLEEKLITPNTINPKSEPEVQSPPAENLGELISTRCLKCHSTEVKKGNIDLTKYFEFDSATKKKVLQVVVDGKMPKESEPLTVEELEFFFNDYMKTKE